MANYNELAETLLHTVDPPSSTPPRSAKTAQKAAAGLGGAGLAGAFLYWLLSCVAGHTEQSSARQTQTTAIIAAQQVATTNIADNVRRVESTQVVVNGRLDMINGEIKEFNKAIGRIEGFIAEQRDRNRR